MHETVHRHHLRHHGIRVVSRKSLFLSREAIYGEKYHIVVIIMTTIRAAAVLLLIAVIAGSGLPGIASAARYLDGTPDLRASILGQNEYSPGDDQVIVIGLENKAMPGTLLAQAVDTGGDPPASALMVTAALLPGDAPVVVKTDPQMVGTILGGSETEIPFSVRVLPDAPGGRYLLPLVLTYTRLTSLEMVGGESVIFHYTEENATIEIPLVVRDVVSVEVTKINADDLFAGGEGYVTLALKNRGTLGGSRTIVRILRDDTSPVIPVTESVYIGNFSPGEVIEARFKVRVEKEAGAASYPLLIRADYEDGAGEALQSREVTVGVPVEGSVEFTVSGVSHQIFQGARERIAIEYENTGAVTVHGARARISAVDPFSAEEDTAYLGDLAPGDRAVANFAISVDEKATVKDYGIDTEVRYRDPAGDNRISDPIRVTIAVRERPGISRILYNPVIMSVIIAGVIGVVYYLSVYRRRRPEE
jgi:hypothetical protein